MSAEPVPSEVGDTSEPAPRFWRVPWVLLAAHVVLLQVFLLWIRTSHELGGELFDEVFGRKLTYCLPTAPFVVGRSPTFEPLPLAACFALVIAILHGWLHLVRMPRAPLALLLGVSMLLGLVAFEPNRLAHYHFARSNLPYVARNVGWSLASSGLIVSCWAAWTRPGWRRVAMSVPPFVLLGYVFACAFFAFHPGVAIE